MLDPNEKSGAALNAAIRDLQEAMAINVGVTRGLLQRIEALEAKHESPALDVSKVPVVEIPPRMTVDTSKLPEYSNSYKEDKPEPGTVKPHPTSGKLEMTFDGRGWVTRLKEQPNDTE